MSHRRRKVLKLSHRRAPGRVGTIEDRQRVNATARRLIASLWRRRSGWRRSSTWRWWTAWRDRTRGTRRQRGLHDWRQVVAGRECVGRGGAVCESWTSHVSSRDHGGRVAHGRLVAMLARTCWRALDDDLCFALDLDRVGETRTPAREQVHVDIDGKGVRCVGHMAKGELVDTLGVDRERLEARVGCDDMARQELRSSSQTGALRSTGARHAHVLASDTLSLVRLSRSGRGQGPRASLAGCWCKAERAREAELGQRACRCRPRSGPLPPCAPIARRRRTRSPSRQRPQRSRHAKKWPRSSTRWARCRRMSPVTRQAEPSARRRRWNGGRASIDPGKACSRLPSIRW